MLVMCFACLNLVSLQLFRELLQNFDTRPEHQARRTVESGGARR